MNKPAILFVSLLLLATAGAFSQIPVNLKARNRATGEEITFGSVARPGGRMTLLTEPNPVTGERVPISTTDLKKYEFIPGDIDIPVAAQNARAEGLRRPPQLRV